MISDASSKTAIIAAYLLAEGEGVEVVGLTFAGNRESGELIHAMSACEVDLAIIHGPSTDERLFSTNLLGEDLVLVGDVRRTCAPRPHRVPRVADPPLVLPRPATELMSRRGVRGPTTSGLPPLPSPACRAHGVRMDSLSMLDAGFLEAEIPTGT